MRIVDANVLLYAVNEDARHHRDSHRWLSSALAGQDTVGLAWSPLLAFVRIATHPGLMPRPLMIEQALELVADWIAAPAAVVVEPTGEHARHLARLLGEVGIGGNLVNDAHLAALAVQQRADVVSYDNDFSRFPGVRWRTPTELLSGS